MYYILLAIFLVFNCNQFQSNNTEKIIIDIEKGEIGNYSYEFWKEYGQASMTLKEDGKFSCSWESMMDALCRIGKRWKNFSNTYEEIGNIKANFEFDYESKGTIYLSIYGWTRKPLVEYYILENWEGELPSTTSFGTISVDGGTYDMYKVTITQYEGEPITQLWSIRNEKRKSGTVSVNKHFETWEKYGFKLGKLYEVTLCVEGIRGTGQASISKNEIIIE